MFKRTASFPFPADHEQFASTGVDQDDVSFATLLRTHKSPLIEFLFRMGHGQAVAEDLAIEVFLRLHSAGRDRRHPADLFRIATDLALGKRRNTTPNPGAKPIADSLDIVQAMASLPGEQRAAVLMHKFHRMDCSQIAHALNCSESAAKSLLLSAYENLRQLLSGPKIATINVELGPGPPRSKTLSEVLEAAGRPHSEEAVGRGVPMAPSPNWQVRSRTMA